MRMGIDAELFHSLYRLNQELKELEKKYNVLSRWNPADKEYRECRMFPISTTVNIPQQLD